MMDVVGRDGIGSGVGELAHGAGNKAYSLPISSPQQTDRAKRRSEWGGGKLKWLSRKRTLGPGPEPLLFISPNELPDAPFAAPFRATVK